MRISLGTAGSPSRDGHGRPVVPPAGIPACSSIVLMTRVRLLRPLARLLSGLLNDAPVYAGTYLRGEYQE